MATRPELVYELRLEDEYGRDKRLAALVLDGDGLWAATGVDGTDLGHFGTLEAAFAAVAREMRRQ